MGTLGSAVLTALIGRIDVQGVQLGSGKQGNDVE